MTKILAVAQDDSLLDELTKNVGKAYLGSVIYAFADPMLAVQHAYNNPVDVVYSEIAMKRLSGFDLLRLLRKHCPNIPVHLVADDDQFKLDAVRATADSYLIRPITAEKIQQSMQLDSENW